jgi:sterol desaturase/sphingolipid hydroxylase (fatty acid hydroxylase superfamily)
MRLRERLYRFRSFWIFPLIAFVLFWFTLHAEPQSRLWELLWLVPTGVLLWTLLEYALHRFVFHIQIPVRDPRLREIINASHLAHHASPRDPSRVLVRPGYGLVISSIVYAILYALTRSLFSTTALVAGIWTGFLYYEAVHYRVHFSLAASAFIARQRRTHFYHHFTNNKQCFGVTSPLWDYVFRTTGPRRSV